MRSFLIPLMILLSWGDLQPVDAQAPASLAPLNRFPRMMQEYYLTRVRRLSNAREARLDSLHTREDAEQYVASVRERIAKCFGEFPQRTPLNPRITGVLQRDGYRIEKLIYESRPGFLVTANLYLPELAGACRPWWEPAGIRPMGRRPKRTSRLLKDSPAAAMSS